MARCTSAAVLRASQVGPASESLVGHSVAELSSLGFKSSRWFIFSRLKGLCTSSSHAGGSRSEAQPLNVAGRRPVPACHWLARCASAAVLRASDKLVCYHDGPPCFRVACWCHCVTVAERGGPGFKSSRWLMFSPVKGLGTSSSHAGGSRRQVQRLLPRR